MWKIFLHFAIIFFLSAIIANGHFHCSSILKNDGIVFYLSFFLSFLLSFLALFLNGSISLFLASSYVPVTYNRIDSNIL
jgi:hypothetical protein